MDNNYGFIRVGAASPRVKVADVSFNIEQIKTIVDRAETDDVSLLVFPELSVTGYTCGDLFSQSKLISAAEDAVLDLCAYTTGKYVTVVVGAPVLLHDRLYNCAIVLRDGQVFGIVPKIHIPAYHEFYEARWFGSGSAFREGVTEVVYAGARVPFGPSQLFTVGGVPFAVELCEDLWTPIPPSSYHAIAGARIIVNLSASNEAVMKHAYRKELVSSQSSRTVSAYIYASSGYGESTQDLVFAGSSLIYENGLMLAESPRFSMDGNLIEAEKMTEDAEGNIYRDSLTSSLGGPVIRRLDLTETPIRFLSGDRVVLMSDGIYRSASDIELAQDLEFSPAEASDKIVQHILEKQIPDQDNMSIIVIEKQTTNTVRY